MLELVRRRPDGTHEPISWETAFTEIAARLERAETEGFDPSQRGATWTYLTTDQPFGSWSERITKGLLRKVRSFRS